MDKIAVSLFMVSAVALLGFQIGRTGSHPNGRRTVSVDSGDEYEGNWINGQFIGNGTLQKSAGQVFEGCWDNRDSKGPKFRKYPFSACICDNSTRVLAIPVMPGIKRVQRYFRPNAVFVGEETVAKFHYYSNVNKQAYNIEKTHIHTVVVGTSSHTFVFKEWEV